MRDVAVWLVAQGVLFLVIACIGISGRVRFLLSGGFPLFIAVLCLVILLLVAYPLAARGYATEGFIAIHILEFIILPVFLVYRAVAEGAVWGAGEGTEEER